MMLAPKLRQQFQLQQRQLMIEKIFQVVCRNNAFRNTRSGCCQQTELKYLSLNQEQRLGVSKLT